MKKISLLYLSLLMIWSCQKRPEYDLVIQNITVFDGNEDLGIVNLAISGDTIAAISTERLLADSIIEGNGKYIIPGLVNAHVHMWESDMLKESFNNGVLTVLDLYDPWGIAPRMRAYRDSLGHSNYYGAGMGATVEGAHPHRTIPHPPNYPLISDTLTPKQFVKIAQESGSEVIKIIRQPDNFEGDNFEGDSLVPMPTLSYDQIQEIIEEARVYKIPSIVHIDDLEDASIIAEFRPSGFAHLWAKKGELTQEDIDVFRESGVFFIATLLLQHNLNLRLEYDKTLSPERIAFEKEKFLNPDSLFERKIYELYEAGIPIIAGTDPPNAGVNYGSDLIEELRIYLKAGIPLKETLKTATGNAAKYLPIDGNGSLEVGGPATFLFLSNDPLKNIDALKSIELIYKNGTSIVPVDFKYEFDDTPFD
ncbi:amidohydrolase family protein [Algoriphagus halophilus]|uniref:amidohydrolase family protein n=1 Tax=Algoriphagus halophilus TaxID=226505 RepID=UPI00358E82EB